MRVCFLGLRYTPRGWNTASLGMMVYIGRSITENDLFAKLVDSRTVIANVNETLALLQSYLDKLQALKIGNVVRIRSTDQGNGPDVALELVANTPLGYKCGGHGQ